MLPYRYQLARVDHATKAKVMEMKVLEFQSPLNCRSKKSMKELHVSKASYSSSTSVGCFKEPSTNPSFFLTQRNMHGLLPCEIVMLANENFGDDTSTGLIGAEKIVWARSLHHKFFESFPFIFTFLDLLRFVHDLRLRTRETNI